MSYRLTATVLVSTLVAMLAAPCLASEGKKSSRAKNEPPPASGFLGDYSALVAGSKGGPLLLFVQKPGILGAYDGFILEPVLVYFHPEARGVGVDPADLTMLTDFLETEVREQLTKAGYRLTDEPGPGVARLRAAITDLEGIDPEKNLGLKAAGVATGVGLLIPSVDVGRASIEVEILDSESGERIVAAVDAARGRRFFNVSKSSKTYGDVKGAFKKWAKQLREQLDRAHSD